MAIDIRAEVSCSLGTVISGSFADDYLQGNGLIKTRGEVVLAGTQTPVVGTQVTFTYDKGGTTYTVPRVLRVLSSFADPFRRTTTVQLGCKLTYLENRKPPVQNPNSKDENSTVPCKVFLQATLPISAEYVFQQCLDALGLDSASIPLTNKFSVEEFDLTPGYVQVMSGLLQSEGYAGYLDSDETLQFLDLTEAASTGPVITPADVVDLGPIGSGDLPGESVVVRWSNLRLLPPDALYGDGYLKRSWEIEEVFAAPSQVGVSYTNDAGQTVSQTDVFYPYSFSATRYDKWDRKIESVSLSVVSAAETNNRWASDAFKKGSGWNRPVARMVHELVEYEKSTEPANAVELLSTLQLSSTTILKNMLSQAAEDHSGLASLCKTEIPEGADAVKSQTTYSYFSEMELAGSLNVDTYISDGGSLVSFDTVAGRLESVVSVQYETDQASGISKTTTTRQISRSQTVSGQQDLARLAQDLDTANLSNSITGLLSSASGLVYNGGETNLHTQREYGLQKRPSQAERNNTANSKPQISESKAEITWITGSTTSTAVTEFTLPYAPDDAISWNAATGQFSSTPSDADQKAMRYGRVQNALLLGNRNGVSLQLAPEQLPKRPFDPLYLQASGITGGYRVNGTSWAFDASGIVASTDALFWGAVSAASGTNLASSWVPLAPGTTSLPLPYTPTGGSVDPETGAAFAAVISPTTVLPPYLENVAVEGISRSSIALTDYPYTLDRGTEAKVAVSKSKVVVGDKLTAAATSYALAGQAAGSAYTRKVSAAVGSFTSTGYSAGSVRSYGIGTNAGTFALSGQNSIVKYQRNPLVAAGTAFNVSGQNAGSFSGKNLIAAKGAIAITGQSASSIRSYVLTGGAGALSLSGQAANLLYVTPQMATALYTGNGSTKTITGLSFQPGLVWLKRRTISSENHWIFDNVRGATKYWLSNLINSEGTDSLSLTAFNSDGFTLSSRTNVNASGALFVAWTWAAGGTPAVNNNGTTASTCSVNTNLGMSIFTYTCSTPGGTVGHGLGQTPELIITKRLEGNQAACVGSPLIGTGRYLELNATTGTPTVNAGAYQNFTSTVFEAYNVSGIHSSGQRIVGYAFVSKPGVSKISTFTGSGASTQAITGLGFSPRWVMVKSISSATSDWRIFDTSRDAILFANSTAVETTPKNITFDADGFTLNSAAGVNTNGASYIYMAFA